MRKVYLDHAGTTPLHPEVYSLMCDFMKNNFGNPSSIHSYGREAKKWVDEARQQVAALIGAEREEIIFTGGGTEADNLAIIGAAAARHKKGNHIITSSIEHPAVLNTCKYLAKNGFEVTYLQWTAMVWWIQRNCAERSDQKQSWLPLCTLTMRSVLLSLLRS